MNTPDRETAEQMVREFIGKDLEAIGIHIPEKSTYNHNYFRLPNGTVVLMVNDDDGYNQVFVVSGEKEVNVGEQWDGGAFSVGDFY